MRTIRVEPRQDAGAIDVRERRLEPEPQHAAGGERDEERPRVDLERASCQHEWRERKRRRNQIEDRQCDSAGAGNALANAFQALRRDIAVQSLVADLDAHPEGERGTRRHACRGE